MNGIGDCLDVAAHHVIMERCDIAKMQKIAKNSGLQLARVAFENGPYTRCQNTPDLLFF